MFIPMMLLSLVLASPVRIHRSAARSAAPREVKPPLRMALGCNPNDPLCNPPPPPRAPPPPAPWNNGTTCFAGGYAPINGYACEHVGDWPLLLAGDRQHQHWVIVRSGPAGDGIVDVTGIVNGGGCGASNMSCAPGACAQPTMASDDDCHQHDDRDFEFHFTPPNRDLLASENLYGNPEAGMGDVGVEWEWMYMFPTLLSHPHQGVTGPALEERTSDGLPLAVPYRGDQIAMRGRHVIDCGHADHGSRTEIHPPVAVTWLHPDNPDGNSSHTGTVWMRLASHFTQPGPRSDFGGPFTATFAVPDAPSGQRSHFFPLVTDWAVDPAASSLTICANETSCSSGVFAAANAAGTFVLPIIPPVTAIACGLGLTCDFKHPWAHIGTSSCALDPFATQRRAESYFNFAFTQAPDQITVRISSALDTNADRYIPDLVGAHFKVCSPECSSEGVVLNGCPEACNTRLPPSPHVPVGWLDGPDAFGSTINGWAVDPDQAPGAAAQVTLVFDISPFGARHVPAGAKFTTPANRPRADLNALGWVGNHGFSFPVPADFRDGSPHLVWALALSGTGQDSVWLSKTPVSFNYRLPGGALNGIDPAVLVANGWAQDPKNPAAAVVVHLYDGPLGVGSFMGAAVANGISAVVPGHGFSFPIPAANRTGRHHIYAYAIDSGGGTNPLIGSASFVKCTPDCPAGQHCNGSTCVPDFDCSSCACGCNGTRCNLPVKCPRAACEKNGGTCDPCNGCVF